MSDGRQLKRTRYTGIYKVTRPGSKDRYMVSYRIFGLGQRTRTFPTEGQALAFQATLRDPSREDQVRAMHIAARITVAQYFDHFMETRFNLSPSTRERYAGVGERYIKYGRLG